MDLSDRGMRMLVEFEGLHKKLPDGRYQSYRCPANVATIYAGLTHGVKDGMIITEEQGQRMLAKELAKFEDAVERLVKGELTQNRFDSLVLLTFNIGIGAFQKSTLLRELNRGNTAAVPGQFMRWVKGGGKTLPGLVRRRAAEAALWSEPAKAPPAPHPETHVAVAPVELMPQKVDPANPPMLQVAAYSNTIRAAVVAAAGTIVQIWDWIFGVAKDAAPDIASNQDALSPLSALFSMLGANMGLISGLVVLGALLAVVMNRLKKDRA